MMNTPAFSLSDPPIYNNDPFLLQPTDDPSTQLAVPKFNGTNYIRWSRAMRIALSANSKLGFIDGTIPIPPISLSNDPTYNQWLRCDCIVMSWIINSIEPQLSDSFLYASSAKQLWDDIQQKFGVSTGPLLYQLEHQITHTIQGDSLVAVYYTTLNKLWDEFGSFFPFPTCTCCTGVCSCGGAKRSVEFEQRRKLIKFLMGLNDGFDSVRAQILMMDPLPSIDTAFAMVLQVEKQRQVIHDIRSRTAESRAVHVIKSSQNVNMNSYCCGYRKELGETDFCNQDGRTCCGYNASAVEPDQDLINAIVQSVVQTLKQKHAVELTIPPQPESSDQNVVVNSRPVTPQINEFDKQQEQEQEQEQEEEQALVENRCADTSKTINHADPSLDLHKEDNKPSLADPFFGATSSDHNQATTPAHSISPSFVSDHNQTTIAKHTVSPAPESSNQTIISEHTLSPAPESSNQTTTSLHTISHFLSASTICKTKEEKVETSDVSTSETILVTKKIGVYTNSQKILLVGEGDFSFSTCLAIAFGSASNMVATSLNSKVFLLKNYGKFSSNEKELLDRGCTIIHGIDATEMATHPQLSCMKFDCIIFNFPHAGFRSKETPDAELGRHQRLVSGFLRNAKDMINKDGQIHIRHKSNGVFLKWNIRDLGTDQGLFIKEETKFKPSKYPGYNTKYGFGGDKDFGCHPSKTYMFELAS